MSIEKIREIKTELELIQQDIEFLENLPTEDRDGDDIIDLQNLKREKDRLENILKSIK